MSERLARWLWPIAVALVVLVTGGAFVAGQLADPVVAVDRPLPDVPATTLDGTALDRAFFDDSPWVVTLWLPG